MLKITLAFCLLVCTFCFVSGQSTEEQVLNIREEFQRINALPQDDLEIIKLENENYLGHLSDGGSVLVGYFEDGKLIKVISSVGISIGFYKAEYYLKNGVLIFAYNQDEMFAEKENGLPAEFDYTRLNVIFEGRYYFCNEELIRDVEKGRRLFGNKTDLAFMLDQFQADRKLLESTY